MKPARLRRFAAAVIAALSLADAQARDRWSEDQANAWYKDQPWLVGANYAPASAINQLEMWQAETFDPERIDRELGWARRLGFNSMRVFLHDLVWANDREGFVERIDRFLGIADRHRIGVMFVLFDGVWDPFPKAGPQREPKPHVHNSGWVQSPGADILKSPSRHDELEGYVKGIVGRYSDDRRVQVWDIFNEPDNPNVSAYGTVELEDKAERAQELLVKAFAWARECSPIQPLTAGVWRGDWSSVEKLAPIDRVMLDESDVVSFHNYGTPESTLERIRHLRRYNRPILCTEYMARPQGSTFANHLPLFREQNVGAYNWGFVAGKSQTIYPWDSWKMTYTAEPEPWFHDIFRTDGTPYRKDEIDAILAVTRREKPSER